MVKDTDQPRPREITPKSIPWTVSTLPLPPDRNGNQPLYHRFSDDDLQAMACLLWFRLDLKPEDDAFFEVDFSPAAREGDTPAIVAAEFWQHVLSPQDLGLLRRLVQGGHLTLRRRVFIARGWALRGGKWIQKLCTRKPAGLSFLIQTFGGRNSVPCNCCEARAYSLFDNETGVWTCEPYFECVSLPESAGGDGVCSNCHYHETISECSYSRASIRKRFGYGAPKRDGALRRSGEVDGQGVVPSAIPQTIKRTQQSGFVFQPYLDAFQEQKKMIERDRKQWPRPGGLVFAHRFLSKEMFKDHSRTPFDVVPRRIEKGGLEQS
ncbi:hypothetical protein QIS74_04987 [Colletotrichum tabaci]|uniref:Uncharacterized protein n=1 Tax=Colletotrichum tabaci TaxID=1209068 RepID=A0AAV9TJ79_9PEZI